MNDKVPAKPPPTVPRDPGDECTCECCTCERYNPGPVDKSLVMILEKGLALPKLGLASRLMRVLRAEADQLKEKRDG